MAVPAWARFLGNDGWAAFEAALEGEMTRRAIAYRLEDGYLWAVWDGAEPEALSLLTLAQLCHSAGPARLRDVITAHFDALVAGKADRAFAATLASDLPRARPLLKVRLYPAGAFAGQEDDYVLRPIADDLVGVLCFDLPANVITVRARTAAGWGVSTDELWFQALVNLRRADRLTVEPVQLGGVTLSSLVGTSFFVASNLLLLTDYLPEPPERGVLVVVPNRHTLVFHPIVDGDAVRAIDPLVLLAADMCAAGPGSVSPHLFWWHDDGQLTTLRAVETEAHVEFTPTPEFVDRVLAPLSPRRGRN